MEIYVLVLSLLTTDLTQSHWVIRGFYTEDSCEELLPAYAELIGKFDNPDGRYLQSHLSCTTHTLRKAS